MQKIIIKKKLYLKLVLYALITSLLITNKANEEKMQNTLDKTTISKATEMINTINKELEQKENEIYWAQNFKSVMVEEMENRSLYDAYLTEYCEYFNLDANKVIGFAKNITNGYEISFQNFIPIKYESWEPNAACMRFVYYLNRQTLINEKYSLNDFKLPEKVDTVPHDNFENLTLLNGKKCIPYLGFICDCFEYEEKEIALSLVYAEAGKDGSPASNNKNNGSGILEGGKIKIYPRLEAWMIEHIGNLRTYYPTNKYNINNLEKFSLKYQQPKTEEQKEDWKKNVADAYQEISENFEELFETEKDTTLGFNLKP